MTLRTTVRLPEDLLLQAKRKASSEGRTLTALIEEGLRMAVAQNRNERTRTAIDIPVSTAKGGFQPGMDGLSYRDLEELDDLEYFERLKMGFE